MRVAVLLLVLAAAPARADAAECAGPRARGPAISSNDEASKRVVRREQAKLAACFAKAEATNPLVARGVLELELVLDLDGSMAASVVEALDPAVDGCVTGVIRKLAFPSVDPDAVTTLAIDFSRGGGAQFDVADPECKAVPARARALAEQLATAIDGGDVAGFAKLLPSKIERFGKKLGRAKVKKQLAAQGFDAWLGLIGGGWVLVPYKKQYALYRFNDVDVTPVEGEKISVVMLKKSGKTWKVRGVVEIPRWPADR